MLPSIGRRSREGVQGRTVSLDSLLYRCDPKDQALGTKAGYVKTLFNGGAIAWARRIRDPLALHVAACA